MGTTINFYDTSEYMFRNSSTKKGGFEGNFGMTDTNTDVDTTGAEDVTRTQTLLLETDRDQLRAQILKLEACAVDAFCTDKGDLVTRAGTAWDRAISLYPSFQSLLNAELEDLKTEMLNNIYLWRNQWRRTAGSSLNCLVQEMETKAEIEMTRRIAGHVAESLRRFKEHETAAIAQAFEHQMTARLRTNEVGLSSMNAIWSILRGSSVEDITDRDYTENRDEDQTTWNMLGKFYHEGIDISDNSGSYNTADAAIGVSEGWAALVPSL